jgi:hypothetical protein
VRHTKNSSFLGLVICTENKTKSIENEREKMNTETETQTTLLTTWDGYQYTSAGLLFDSMTGEEFAGLDDDEKLRLALFAANQHAAADELVDLIETEQEAYRGEYHSGAEMAEQFCDDIGDIPADLPNWLVIDWAASWERNLRHDFFEYDVRHNGEYRRFFWYAY